MSGTKDTNWISFVGPQDNGRTVTPSDWAPPVNPREYDDLVKGSNVIGLTVQNLEIPASRKTRSILYAEKTTRSSAVVSTAVRPSRARSKAG